MNKEEFKQVVIGKTIEQANKLSPQFKVRVVSDGSSQFLLTMDYDENRLNVGIRNNKIVSAKNFG